MTILLGWPISIHSLDTGNYRVKGKLNIKAVQQIKTNLWNPIIYLMYSSLCLPLIIGKPLTDIIKVYEICLHILQCNIHYLIVILVDNLVDNFSCFPQVSQYN